MRRRTFFALLAALSLAACGERVVFNPTTVETDAGEALLRHVFQECPYAKRAVAACIVLGAEQMEASEEFRKRFSDLGLRILSHKEITVTGVGDKTRIHSKRNKDGTGGEEVLLLQITEIKSAGGNYHAIAAWAFNDDMERRRYEIIPGEKSTFTIQPGEILAKKSASPQSAPGDAKPEENLPKL